MDVLAATGLINHFGQVAESDNITVSPILLRKGSTKLALYGLANVRDERLFRTFREGQVKFLRPEGAQEEWFNLMAVHQNQYVYLLSSYMFFILFFFLLSTNFLYFSVLLIRKQVICQKISYPTFWILYFGGMNMIVLLNRPKIQRQNSMCFNQEVQLLPV